MNEIIKFEETSALELAKNHYTMMTKFVKEQMKIDIDYGVIPGTNGKSTLLKPGAEKLCRLLNLRPTFQLINSSVNFDKPLFYYHYQCSLYYQSELVGQGDGSCNSYEKKYRYRKSELICPCCHQPTVIKGKEEYGGGYLCYKKKGGCGSKFSSNDQDITNQNVGLINNPDIFDSINTIQKMAQKRALIAAVLCTVGASEFFTQDLEDNLCEQEPSKNITPQQSQLSGIDGARSAKKPLSQPAYAARVPSSSETRNGKSHDDWYQRGKNDALNNEAMRYTQVKPYVNGYFEGEKQKNLSSLNRDIHVK